MPDRLRLSFERTVMRMTPEQIVLAHRSPQFSETCRLTVRDTENEPVRDHIVNALWRALFE